MWEATLQLAPATGMLYKYMIATEGNGVFLEEASPRLIDIKQDIHGETILVHDTWQVDLHREVF